MRDYKRPLVEPDPPGGVLINREPKVRDDRISGLTQDVSLHRIRVWIVEDHAEMIKTDNSPKRVGHTRQQASQVGAARERTRQGDNRLIDVGS